MATGATVKIITSKNHFELNKEFKSDIAAGTTAIGTGVVDDLAVPPAAIPGILQALPEGAVVILQKPMGADLAEADAIIRNLRARNLRAAVNFQLRFAPALMVLKDAIAQGLLGEVVDFNAHSTSALSFRSASFGSVPAGARPM